MIVLFPIAWPFLVIWLMFKYWWATLLLSAIGLCAVVYAHSAVAGSVLFLALLVLVIRLLAAHQRKETHERFYQHQAHMQQLDREAENEYAKMEIQAELNARAMAKAAREMR